MKYAIATLSALAWAAVQVNAAACTWCQCGGHPRWQRQPDYDYYDYNYNSVHHNHQVEYHNHQVEHHNHQVEHHDVEDFDYDDDDRMPTDLDSSCRIWQICLLWR
ncbi:hypothetical protein FRC00_010730, partial [Tulasnella sp. 408]